MDECTLVATGSHVVGAGEPLLCGISLFLHLSEEEFLPLTLLTHAEIRERLL